eukprot:2788424-Pyramimonas_sp.AAC.1
MALAVGRGIYLRVGSWYQHIGLVELVASLRGWRRTSTCAPVILVGETEWDHESAQATRHIYISETDENMRE